MRPQCQILMKRGNVFLTPCSQSQCDTISRDFINASEGKAQSSPRTAAGRGPMELLSPAYGKYLEFDME